MTVDYSKLVGQRLRHERNRCGMTLEAAAEMNGMHPDSLSRAERGQRPINLAEFIRLSITYTLNPGELLDDAIAQHLPNRPRTATAETPAEQARREIKAGMVSVDETLQLFRDSGLSEEEARRRTAVAVATRLGLTVAAGAIVIRDEDRIRSHGRTEGLAAMGVHNATAPQPIKLRGSHAERALVMAEQDDVMNDARLDVLDYQRKRAWEAERQLQADLDALNGIVAEGKERSQKDPKSE